jgi:hypothetical protein
MQIVAPRGSYLPLVTQNVRDHFVLSAPVLIDEMWFDYKGTPLRWYGFILIFIIHITQYLKEKGQPQQLITTCSILFLYCCHYTIHTTSLINAQRATAQHNATHASPNPHCALHYAKHSRKLL